MTRTTHELRLIAAALARSAARVYDAIDEADPTVAEPAQRDQLTLLEGLGEEDLKMVAVLTAPQVALMAETLSEVMGTSVTELLDAMIHAVVDQGVEKGDDDEGDQT